MKGGGPHALLLYETDHPASPSFSPLIISPPPPVAITRGGGGGGSASPIDPVAKPLLATIVHWHLEGGGALVLGSLNDMMAISYSNPFSFPSFPPLIPGSFD